MVLIGGLNPRPKVTTAYFTFRKVMRFVRRYCILLDLQLKGIAHFCAMHLKLPVTCILHSIPYFGIVQCQLPSQCRNAETR